MFVYKTERKTMFVYIKHIVSIIGIAFSGAQFGNIYENFEDMCIF